MIDIFSSVRSKSNSGLENQQISAALLFAVEETIKEKQSPLVPTAYYASLITLLQQQLENTRDNQQQICACVQLLSLLFPSLSQQLLRSQFLDIANTLSELAERLLEHPSPATSRYLLTCFAYLLSAQESSAWAAATANQIFQTVLIHVMDERPKVRKSAVSAVHLVLANSPPPMAHHPACSAPIKFFQHALKQSQVEKNILLHSLNLLKECWKYFKPSQVDQMSDTLLAYLARQGDSAPQMVLQKLLECLEACSELRLKSDQGDAQSIGKFIDRLLAFKPNINDSPSLTCWLSTLFFACKRFCNVDSTDVHSFISKSFLAAFSYLQITPNTAELATAAHKPLASFMEGIIECIPDSLVTKAMELNSPESDLQLMIAQMSKGLTLTFQSGWETVFLCIANLIRKLGTVKDAPLAPLFMKDILVVLSDDEVYAQNPHFKHLEAFTQVMAESVKSLGVQRFLDIFPLNLEDQTPCRSWLLPVLQDSVINANLEFFINYFVPLSLKIAQRGHSLVTKGKAVESKNCAVIWRQIWDLLPSFCNVPVDVQSSFEPFCELVVPMLNSDDDRCVSVLESLRNLVVKYQHVVAGKLDGRLVTRDEATQHLVYLSRYAERLFGPLFTKYVAAVTKKSVEMKNIVMEAIKCWAVISDAAVLNKFFETTLRTFLQLSKAEETEDTSTQKHALLDLANVMIPTGKLSPEALEVFSRMVLIAFASDDSSIQKKSYKSLSHIFSASEVNAETPVFMEDPAVTAARCKAIETKLSNNAEFIGKVCNRLLETALVTDTGAKKDRFAVLNKVLARIDWKNNEHLQLIPGIVSEIILGTKESNERAREQSYAALVTLAHKCRDIAFDSGNTAQVSVDDEGEAFSFPINLDEFCKMVLAGLAGKTPHMISATIHGLSRLLYEFHKERMRLSPETNEAIVQSVIMYCEETKNREIIRACIGFVKVLLVTHQNMIFNQAIGEDETMGEDGEEQFIYLKKIIQVLTKWSGEHKSHFKVPCRYTLERILRKVEFSVVESYFPEEHLKLLKNIRKRKERDLKKKSSPNEAVKSFDDIMKEEHSDVSDAEMDDEELPQVLRELVQMRTKSKKGTQMILDDNEDMPVDFLDRKMASSSLNQKSAKAGKKRRHDFDMQDGKIVIENSDTENNEEQILAGRASEVHQEYMESVTSKETFKRSGDGKKIKFSNKRSRMEDDETDNSKKPSKVAPSRNNKKGFKKYRK